MIRRMFRQVGSVAIAGWLWQHRGSVVRSTDLARRLPELVAGGRTGDALTEAKAVAALDGVAPTDAKIRITGIDEGAVTLRGGVPADALDAARQAILSVSDVLDVQTDAGEHPTLDDALTGATS